MVIKALSDGIGHVPFRDSRLTRLLMDSLGKLKIVDTRNNDGNDYNNSRLIIVIIVNEIVD